MEREGVAGGREEERERQGREVQGRGRQGESVCERVRVNVSPMTSTTEGPSNDSIYHT